MSGKLIGRALCLVCAYSFAASAQSNFSFSGPVQEVDGRLGEQYAGSGTKDVQVRRRPWSPTDNNLLLENIYVHHVTNQKAMDIGVTDLGNGVFQAYNNITVRNYYAHDIYRDGNFDGLHTDFLRIAGQGGRQDRVTNVRIENAHFSRGDAVPLIIQDGDFGTIVLKNIKIDNTDRFVQISTMSVGTIRQIIVEDSPGLRVGIQGRPGTIGEVIVKNSPGAQVEDLPFGANDTYSGVNIEWNDSYVVPDVLPDYPASFVASNTGGFRAIPEPSSIAALLAMALPYLRRRRSV